MNEYIKGYQDGAYACLRRMQKTIPRICNNIDEVNLFLDKTIKAMERDSTRELRKEHDEDNG